MTRINEVIDSAITETNHSILWNVLKKRQNKAFAVVKMFDHKTKELENVTTSHDTFSEATGKAFSVEQFADEIKEMFRRRSSLDHGISVVEEIKEIIESKINMTEINKELANEKEFKVENLVEEILRYFLNRVITEDEMSKSHEDIKKDETIRNTFHPKEIRTPDYLDELHVHEFMKQKHNSVFTEDIQKINFKVNDLLFGIMDLETKPVMPGTELHREILSMYCQFLSTTNQLKDFQEKLISLERRILVGKMIENSIIGLLKCKNKLTTIEASNITYTINTILMLRINLNEIETDIPKFETYDRMNELRQFISKVEENVKESEENEGLDNFKVDSETVIMTADRKVEEHKLAVIDLIISSHENQYMYGNRESNQSHQESPLQNLRKNFDSKSLLLLERLLYVKIFVKHNIRTFNLVNFIFESEEHYQDYIRFLVFLDGLEASHDWPKKVKQLVTIQKQWRGFRDRQKYKALKRKYYLFYNIIKSSPEKITEEHGGKIEEEQKDYLDVYQKMYVKVFEFIDRYKKFEYTRGTILKIMAHWREKNRKEFPLFIKSVTSKMVRTGFRSWRNKAFVEYADVIDLIKLELRSICYKPEKLQMKPLESHVSLQANLHEKMNPFHKDHKFSFLKDNNTTEDMIPSKTLDEPSNNKEDKKSVSDVKRAINLSMKTYEDIAPEIKKELVQQKVTIQENTERKKEEQIEQEKLRNVYYDVTVVLSSVVEEVFEDLKSKENMEKDNLLKFQNEEKPRSFTDGDDFSSDLPMKDMIIRLIQNKIIVNYPEARFTDFYGTLCYSNESLIFERNDTDEPLYTSKWVLQAVKEFCVLPLFSEKVHKTAPLNKSVFLAGPPKSGKHMIVNAVCTHVGAVKFDLSARTIRESEFFGKDIGMKALEDWIMKVSRYLQPCVFYVNEAHRSYLLSNPPALPVVKTSALSIMSGQDASQIRLKSEDNSDASFLKDILGRLAAQITKNDMILIMGISNKPYQSDIKLVEQNFNRILLLPRVDYNTARQYLFEKIMSVRGKAGDPGGSGLPIPDIDLMLSKIFTVDRLNQLCERNQKPIMLDEFLSILKGLKGNVVSEDFEILMLEWYNGSKIGKLRPAVLKKWKTNAKPKTESKIKEISATSNKQ
ncbi:dynein regulatory complex protein 11-like [Diaphorina citri]|uniref:Dynein regulatory complex protein 11-like n=1 Tax=Diaphorina citri TaxID=121845 RepID=A0A3Q0IW21_DIACI|nr:dynein regulatory complex protein 11-like [Diaphorina citri]